MKRVTSYAASTSPAQTRPRRNELYRACVETLEARRLLSFSPAATYAADGPRDVEVGDFNGDGHADLVTANISAVGVRLNKGDGTFHEQVSYPMGGEHVALAVAVGDLNGDGKLDVTVTTTTERISGYHTNDYYGIPYEYPIYTRVGHVKVLLGGGDGTFTPSTETKDLGDGAFFAVELADLDEDGDLDAAATNWDGDEIAILPGDGDGTFGEPSALTVGAVPQSVDIADLNGDGNLDLVTTNLYADVKVILGNGDGTFKPAQAVSPGGDYAQGQAVGDVNGDGKLDLVVTTKDVTYVNDWSGYYTTYTEGRITVLLGKGDGTFATGNSYWADSEALDPVELADFNGDGKLDVAAASYYAGHVNVLHGDGDGTFGAPEVLDIGYGVANIVVADLDGDATLDIVSANYGRSTLSVFLNGYVPPPSLSIRDATVTEVDAGIINSAFTVTLSEASDQTVTVQYAAADGLAVSGRDFDAATGTVTFAPGETSKTISVAVRGDLIDEYDEFFYVNLFGAAGAQIADGEGVGRIIDNDPPPTISIADASRVEGQSGSVALNFTISLSAASEKDILMDFATADGTAKTADNDYQSSSGNVFIAAGQTSVRLSVFIIGDKRAESNETFFVNLSGAVDAVFADGQAIGTILNDDKGGGGGKGSGRVK